MAHKNKQWRTCVDARLYTSSKRPATLLAYCCGEALLMRRMPPRATSCEEGWREGVAHFAPATVDACLLLTWKRTWKPRNSAPMM